VNSFDFTVDRQLRVVGINRGLEKARTDSSEPFLGHLYHDVLPLIFHNGAEAVGQVVLNGQPLTLKDQRVACWHQPSQADIDISPLLDGAGKTTGARVNITLREGCSLVAHLKKSQHLIEIGKNAAILSHGVRNPLNAIKGAVVYLKNRYSQEATLLEFTRIMEEEISQLDRFITGFLSGSAGEAEKRSADLNELLKKIEKLISLQAGTSGIELAFRYGKTLPMKIDPFQIEHAILNVINNALNALSPGGKIRVESRAEVTKGASFMVVEISDNGPGISGGTDENYLSPLQESARSRGKGFGLFITREILQHHGGMLELTSRKNQGTTVRLVLPAAEGDHTL
jgi:two-component system nitrogen regulation sensor histidine kinase GlnL